MPVPGGPRPTESRLRPLTAVASQVGARSVGAAVGDVRVSGISLGSRTVRPGDLYAALPGRRAHGADHAGAAIDAGAVAVLTDPAGWRRLQSLGESRTPVLVVEAPRAVLGGLAAWFHAAPAEQMLTLGVTGTNGKTTTTFLLDAALRAVGHVTGLIGTVEIRIGDERVPSSGTTPEAPDLHALLAVMRERGVTACSMEISSHALDQHRVDGLLVDVAGFTNLSQDHLDYHDGMDGYFAAKAVLFRPDHARRAVVCVDDAWGRRLADEASIPVVTVRSRYDTQVDTQDAAPAADWTVLSRRVLDGTPQARVRTPGGGVVELHSPLPGDFNLANCLLAVAMLVEAGVGLEVALHAVSTADPVPGRMQRVLPAVTGTAARPPGTESERAAAPLAVVDYAHTPAAVRAATAALADAGHPLVVVLGAGGDRDRDKRAPMGAAAAATADVVIVTDDNPRSEDPAVIRAQVLEGALAEATRSGCTVLEVADRGHAIAEAVARAWGRGAPPGVVLVAGKGHEPGQEVAGTVRAFDDRVVLASALAAAARELPDRTRR